jgi:hypothetical protein
MATNQHTTAEEVLEAVFSVVHAAAVALQRRGKHISAATNQHSTIEELMERCFIRGPCQGVISGQVYSLLHSCVEAGSNTSTVTLQVVGGDEKGK